MSETNSNEYVRKRPFDRSSASDFPDSANRQRSDGTNRISQGGKNQIDDAAFDELSDTEWLNITLENILKMNNLQDESDQTEYDVNSLVLSSLESMQSASSVPSSPVVHTEISMQQLPPEKTLVINDAVSHDNAHDTSDDEPSELTEINNPDSWQPDALPEADSTDLTLPAEIPEMETMDPFEPSQLPETKIADLPGDANPPEIDHQFFGEPAELSEVDNIEDDNSVDSTDSWEPVEPPEFDYEANLETAELTETDNTHSWTTDDLPEIDNIDSLESEELFPIDGSEYQEPDDQSNIESTESSETTGLPPIDDSEYREPDEQYDIESTESSEITELPPIDDSEYREPDEQYDIESTESSEITESPPIDSPESPETDELPPIDSPEYWEPDEHYDTESTESSEITELPPIDSPEFPETDELPPIDSPEYWEPDKKQESETPITAQDPADETVSTVNSQIDAQKDISGTFDSIHVSISDGFSLPYEDASDNVDGFSKASEVDKMEHINILTKASKKPVMTKKNETDYYSHGISKTLPGVSEANSNTLVISLRSVIGFIMKNAVIVLLAALMCSMVGYIFTQKYVKHKYLSNTKIIIFTSEPNDHNPPSWDDLQLSFTLLTDCSQIVKSRDVLEDVIKELELSTSYNELLDNINVSFMSNSRIIEISVTDEDPLQAMIIVRKLREVSMRYINDSLEVYGSKIIQKENIPHQPLPTYTKYYVMVGAVIGILLSSGVLAVIYILHLEKEFVKKQQKTAAKKK